MEQFSELWSLKFISWITSGGVALLNILILLIFFGAIYFLYLLSFSIFFRKPIKEAHETALSNIEDSYIFTTIGGALNDFGTAFARAIAGVIKGIATPVQLFFSTINGVLFAPLERWIEKKQQEIETKSHKDQIWRVIQTRNEMERIKIRATHNRMLHEVRREAKEAKKQGRLTNFPNQDEIQKIIEGSQDTDQNNTIDEKESTNESSPLELIETCGDVFSYANLCIEGFNAGLLQNLSVRSVAEFLQCPEAQARDVRKHLVKTGFAQQLSNGRLKRNRDKSEIA